MAEEKELTEEQKKRKAQVQFEAQSYTEEDWDNIIAKLEANTELKESVLGKDLTIKDYVKRMVELESLRAFGEELKILTNCKEAKVCDESTSTNEGVEEDKDY
ncbi:hypothetical protein Tco_0355626 [Tanacetum coccineum]